ncbi:hypothetical protein AGRA3207_007037 [Actinomadura graeca]|uniref:DUF222 domain-containing protein n=1 Tax=Actinomadura graeca TaxID=2750812 RepID=A0ABX8R389_9ACTN|nr:hypothetical protein [Actinomadura graeca]QXJ25530.1 hypothetical protein AGRA3207_007037 [Actinomadura graeca]
MRQDKPTSRPWEEAGRGPAAARRPGGRDTGVTTGVTTGVKDARDEAARALAALDTAYRRSVRARRAGDGVPPAMDDGRLTEAAHALAQAARDLARTLHVQDRPAARPSAPSRARRPADNEPLVTLDLAHRIGPGWRLCQFTHADRDAHRWHVRHDGHVAGIVTHYLNLRGERAGWEAHDARGFRLRPGTGHTSGRPPAHLWETRVAAVRAVADVHPCPEPRPPTPRGRRRS